VRSLGAATRLRSRSALQPHTCRLVVIQDNKPDALGPRPAAPAGPAPIVALVASLGCSGSSLLATLFLLAGSHAFGMRSNRKLHLHSAFSAVGSSENRTIDVQARTY